MTVGRGGAGGARERVRVEEEVIGQTVGSVVVPSGEGGDKKVKNQ